MDHGLMLLVLVNLAEVKSGTSREIAENLKIINPKHVSVLLSRCFRRGLVQRTPYKFGRERGYVYKLSEKGANWILHRASKKKTELPSEGQTKVIEKPVLVLIHQPIQPTLIDSDFKEPGYFAFKNVFVNCMSQVPEREHMPIHLLIARNSEEEIFFAAKEIYERNRREQTGKFLVEMVKIKGDMTRMLLRYCMKTKKPESSKYLEPKPSFRSVEIPAAHLVSAEKKAPIQLQEHSISQEEIEGRFCKDSSIEEYMNRWWNMLPECSSREFDDFLQRVPRVKKSPP